jgi:Na+/proline symporter
MSAAAGRPARTRIKQFMNIVLWGVLAYVVVQFLLGAWVSRRISSDTDYIAAGRSLGTSLIAFSVFATWFGAEALVTSAGEVYAHGLAGAKLDPFGYGGAVILVGILLAARVWLGGATTFADIIRERFSTTAEKVFVFVLLPGSVFWAAAQIRAFGQILSATSSLDVVTAIVIAATLVALYSAVGGLLADAITDVVQGLVVICGLMTLTTMVAITAGGLTTSFATLDPVRLNWFSADDGWPALAEKLAITVCGSLVSIELISRFLGARSAGIARTGTIIGGVMYLTVGLMPLYIGLMAPRIVPNLVETEQVVPKVAETLMPTYGFAIFAGALVSAILSVVHAALHAPAAQISRNVLVPAMPQLSERARLTAVRLAVVVLSIVALGLALAMKNIRELVETASAIGSAGAVVVVFFGLFTSLGGAQAASATLVAGGLLWAAFKFVAGVETPYLFAVGSSIVIYLIVARFEDHRPLPVPRVR